MGAWPDNIDTDRAIARRKPRVSSRLIGILFLASPPSRCCLWPAISPKPPRSGRRFPLLTARIMYRRRGSSSRWRNGVPVAQSYLGFMFETGRGVPQNFTEAAMWYRRAAEQGDSLAQYSLGLLYDEGFGVPRDIVEASKWLNLSTAAASPRAREARAYSRRRGHQDDARRTRAGALARWNGADPRTVKGRRALHLINAKAH